MSSDTPHTIADVLAAEAEMAERTKDDPPGPRVRSQRPPKDPSEVYSLRIPIDRLDEVRRLAGQGHATPAALLRRWILERLDVEAGRRPVDGSDEARRQVADALRKALAVVENREIA